MLCGMQGTYNFLRIREFDCQKVKNIRSKLKFLAEIQRDHSYYF